MITGIDIKQRIEYSDPKDTENPTIFVLKPLTSSERFNLSGNIKDGKMQLNGRAALDTFLVIVDEIRNFNIGEEHFDSAKDAETKTRFFESIRSMEIFSAIFTKAMTVSTLTQEEAKN